jgi:hypothetical protein
VSPKQEGPGGFEMREAPPARDEHAPITFVSFLISLSSAALVHLGVPLPGADPSPERNLPLARQTIDILELLRAKTEGNLDPSERKLFDELLHDLRLRYLEASKSA